GKGGESLYPCEGCAEAIAVAMPILAAGDMVGAVALLSGGKGQPDDTLVKSVQIAAAFLARQMEE
ncbi:MAG: stage V sporulation protein T, partial [Oscillospiraceae bacterium]|nr:stage V sporulation protein T [Oscillospiraceae bacterium]